MWQQCPLTGIASRLRKDAAASMQEAIPVRKEAASVCSVERSEEHHGGRGADVATQSVVKGVGTGTDTKRRNLV